MDRWLARPPNFRLLVALAVAVRIAFVLAPFDVLDPVDGWEVGRSLWRGDVPYRDVALEYPPAALVAFLLPGAVPHGLAPHVLAVQAFAVEAVVFLLLRRHPEALRRYLLISLPMVPLLSGGFDSLPLAAIAWSTALLAGGNARGWWVAGAGAAVKLFPGVAWGWGRRHLAVGAVALVAAAATWLLPLAVADSDRTPIGYHLDRGVQNESVAASLTFATNSARGIDSETAYRFRSNEIVDGEGAATLTLAVFAVVGLAIAVSAPARPTWSEAHFYALALLLGALCASKVLSPQFIALATPLVAVIGGRWFLAYLPIAVLTIAQFAVDDRRSDLFMGLAAVRNAGLVAVTVAAATVACRRLRRRG